MQLKYLNRIALAGLLFFGFLFVWWTQPHHIRNLSSSAAPQIFLPAAFEINISAPAGIPNEPSQEIKIQARIHVKQELQSDLQYEWQLPNGVDVVEGQVDDGLANVKKDQDVLVEITLTGLSKQDYAKILVFRVHANTPAGLVAANAIFTTHPEILQFPRQE